MAAFLDKVSNLFKFEPNDNFTKQAMVAFMKERYPGNYEVAITFTDKGYDMTLKFATPSEQTMFFLRYA